MAFAIWSPTISKSLSACGGGAEDMAGGEIEEIWRLESSVTASSVFRRAREVTINAHIQMAAIANAQPPIIFSLPIRSCAPMSKKIRNGCASKPKPRQLRADLPLNGNCPDSECGVCDFD